jgi:solute carrier family 10 (sodium/bile acid cotransporter), member 7
MNCSKWIHYFAVLAGIGLNVRVLPRILRRRRLKFNLYLQAISFGIDSAIVYGVTRAMIELNITSKALGDGMVICSTLPMSISTVSVLTRSGGGDVASATVNSMVGTMLGIVLSPVLMMVYVGWTAIDTPADPLFHWALRIIVPLLSGIGLHGCSKRFVALVKKYRHMVAVSQLYAVSFIVYTCLCKTFHSRDEIDSTVLDVFGMMAGQWVLFLVIAVLAWIAFRVIVPFDPALRVMAFFGCTQKTVSVLWLLRFFSVQFG